MKIQLFKKVGFLFALAISVVGANAQAERTTTYMHSDALGSVIAASDDDGNVLWRKQYQPFGLQVEGSNESEEVSYTGKKFNKATGLSYYGARHYDPFVGRFVSVDPVGALGATTGNRMMFNRYAYGNNNPYRYLDPDGREPFSLFDFDFGGNAAGQRMSQLGLSMADRQKPTDVSRKAAGQIVFESASIITAEAYAEQGATAAVESIAGAGTGKLVGAVGGRLATKGIPDSALVVRGGNEANQAAAKINAAIGPSRTPGVEGFSAQCNGGTCLSTLAGVLKNKQVGVTTAGDIRKAGGDVITTPGFGNHVTVTNLSGEAASPLFKVVKNPNPAK